MVKYNLGIKIAEYEYLMLISNPLKKMEFLTFITVVPLADFSLLNLPKGKSLGRSKPATNS
jgi:hypothetical protein